MVHLEGADTPGPLRSVPTAAEDHSDLHWIADHDPELYAKYPGRWIAVHDERVIADGDTATDVDAKARKQSPDGQYVLMAVDQDPDSIRGLR